MAERPLAGRRIVVTRPRAQAGALAEALQELGATVETVPLVAIEPIAGGAELDEALQKLDRYDWVVFTSVNGVAAAREYAEGLSTAKVAAVGPATASALRALGTDPSYVPEQFAAAQIAPGLEPLAGSRVLLLQADIAEPALADELERRGASVDAAAAYRTIEIEPSAPELATMRSVDAVILASGSAARSLARQGGAGDALVVCIGPGTAEIARELGLPVGLTAHEATADGIIQALTSHFGGRE